MTAIDLAARLQATYDAEIGLLESAYRDALAGRRGAESRLRDLIVTAGDARVRLDIDVRAWSAQAVAEAYIGGAVRAAELIGVPYVHTAQHAAAVKVLVDETTRTLLAGNRRALAAEKAQIRQAIRDRAKAAERVTVIEYAGGRRVPLDTYVEMAARTAAKVAENTGVVAHSKASGIEAMLCSDGFECGLYEHGTEPLADGLLVSVDIAADWPVAHPHCTRTWEPVVGSAADLELDIDDGAETPEGPQSAITEKAIAAAVRPTLRAASVARQSRSESRARGRTARTARVG